MLSWKSLVSDTVHAWLIFGLHKKQGRKKKVIERNNVIHIFNVPCILAITCSHCRHRDRRLDQWVAVLHSRKIRPAAG